MKAIEFKHQNRILGEDQPEYQPLPALRLATPEGEVISCWRLSFKERVKLLFTGRIWLMVMTFNEPLAPVLLTTNRKEVFLLPTDKEVINNQIKTKP